MRAIAPVVLAGLLIGGCAGTDRRTVPSVVGDVRDQPLVWTARYDDRRDDVAACLRTRAAMDSHRLQMSMPEAERDADTVRVTVSELGSYASHRADMIGAYSLHRLGESTVEVEWRQRGKPFGGTNFESWARANADHCGKRAVRVS